MSRSMGDSHRRFLQNMMNCGIISFLQARDLHKLCCETHGAQYLPDKMDDFIEVINGQLQPMFMQIRKCTCEENGDQYYVLANVTDTDITRMASDYADNELELFRKTMNLIIESESGSASSTDILNCADTLQTRKLKKKEAEHVLDRFVKDKWLNEKRGEYTLSVRSIVEMEQYMRMTYQDLIKTCHVCHNIVLQCQICENPKCGIRIHLPCVARYFKGRRGEPCCPSCKEVWPHGIPEIQSPQSSQSASAKQLNDAGPSTSRTQRSRRS